MSRYVENNEVKLWPVLRDGILILLAVIASLMYGCPHYNVWQQGLAGQAELRRAEQNRMIAVQEATAKKEAAVMLAEAEVERARGVASANRIIAEGLRGHDEYLRYLWITEVAGKGVGNTIVYVPTEANLPILEAGRFSPPSPAEAKK